MITNNRVKVVIEDAELKVKHLVKLEKK